MKDEDQTMTDLRTVAAQSWFLQLEAKAAMEAWKKGEHAGSAACLKSVVDNCATVEALAKRLLKSLANYEKVGGT